MPGLQGLLAVGPAHRLQGPLARRAGLSARSEIGPPTRRAFLCLALSACRPLLPYAMHIHKHDPNDKPAPSESLWETELTLLAFALGLLFFWALGLLFS